MTNELKYKPGVPMMCITQTDNFTTAFKYKTDSIYGIQLDKNPLCGNVTWMIILIIGTI